MLKEDESAGCEVREGAPRLVHGLEVGLEVNIEVIVHLADLETLSHLAQIFVRLSRQRPY